MNLLVEKVHYPALSGLTYEELKDKHTRTQNVYWNSKRIKVQRCVIDTYHYYLSLLEAELTKRREFISDQVNIIERGDYFELN